MVVGCPLAPGAALSAGTFEFGSPVAAEEFRALPSVVSAVAEGTVVTVSFEGSADAVVKLAATHEVRAVRPREDDLEDIFLR